MIPTTSLSSPPKQGAPSPMPLQEIDANVPRGPRTSDVPIKKPAVCHTPAPTKTAPINSKPKKAPRRKKLSAKWLFDASMLSSPMDLSPLVSMSLERPKMLWASPGC